MPARWNGMCRRSAACRPCEWVIIRSQPSARCSKSSRSPIRTSSVGTSSSSGDCVVVMAAAILATSSLRLMANVQSRSGSAPMTMRLPPKERRAFMDLYKMSAPAPRLKAARVFLTEYPDSWLLAEVCEIAAKASIDLGEFPTAISYAKESLRLFPENPLLLVPLANAQIEQGLLHDGERSAQDALEYLDRFSHPSSVPESEWPALLAQLKASSLRSEERRVGHQG